MLNKRGWGITNEIVFLLIFVICLLIFFIGISRLGLFDKPVIDNNDNNNGALKEEYTYSELEDILVRDAKLYISDVYNNKLGLDTLIIKVRSLKNKGYLKEYTITKYEDCSGYIEVYKGENEINYEPYIKCEKYETNGYVERKDNRE